ncbi:hypothetical protein J3P89_20125 [Pseudomonas sp. Z1-14]|uniref:hypothetical protein n=1 Tax=Pseudomonas sp. Z1-14 TaxID=2817409 RepID=UPI003DA98951
MKTIEQYSPPSADALARLKINLGYTSQQMAELVGLAQGSGWAMAQVHGWRELKGKCGRKSQCSQDVPISPFSRHKKPQTPDFL